MNIFTNYADIYDDLYKEKNYDQEVNYVLDLISNNNKIQNILELGCGTGRHAIELARRGYNVLGIDISKKMIASALDKKSTLSSEFSEKLDFQISDIRAFQSHRTWDLVLSLFHVISYQTTNDDLIKTFSTAYNALQDNGLFIFDCWNGSAVIKDPPKEKKTILTTDKKRVLKKVIPTHIPEIFCFDIKFYIKTEPINDKLQVNEFSETHRMRYLFEAEVINNLKSTGFRSIKSYTWLSKSPISELSWSACYIAQK